MQTIELVPVPRSFRILRGVLVLVLLLSGLTTTALFTPGHHVEYTVRDGIFTVDVQLGAMEMGRRTPLTAVRAVAPVDPRGAWRTSGTGMHDLCHGQWHLADGTAVWMATTCTAPALQVEVDGERRPWVVSPADPEGLAAALTGGTSGRFPARVGPPEPWFWSAVRFGTPLLLFGILVILMRAGRGLGVTLDRSTLHVATGWRTLHLSLAGATVKRGLTDQGRVWAKGIRLGSVWLGPQRSTRGRRQMLVTDPTRVVEVHPADGVPVAISVVDPAAFIAACVAAGARTA